MQAVQSDYVYPHNAREISGFGGEYEKGCRAMVIAGMRWIDAHPLAKLEFKEFEGIIGITMPNDDMARLQNAMVEAIGDCTGAMMHACSRHVLHAHRVGWKQYISELGAEGGAA